MSGDGLTWRLFVRPGVRFQDGSPLTAADIKRTFDAVIAVPASRNLRVCLPNVSSIVAASDREAVFTLTRRCSYLLDDLDRAINRTAADGTTRLGTGAFSITSSSAEGVTLEANRYYHAGPPVIDRVVVQAVRRAADGLGRDDAGPGRLPVGGRPGDGRVPQRSHRGRGQVLPRLLCLRPDAEFREAAVPPRGGQASAQHGGRSRGDRAAGPQGPRRRGGRPDLAPLLGAGPGAPRRCRSIGRRPRPSSAPRARVRSSSRALCRPTSPSSNAWHCSCSSNWREVNVRMRLESLPPDDFNRRIVSGRVRRGDAVDPRRPVALRYSTVSGTPPARRNAGTSGAIATRRVDAALDAALDAASDREFSDAIRRFEAAVRDDPPAVFLAWNRTVQAVSRRFVVPAGDAERDAIYMLSRWRLRPPGSAAR